MSPVPTPTPAVPVPGGVATLVPTSPPVVEPAIVVSPCESKGAICDFVYQHTHHAWLADLAKVVITRPLPILAIVACAILVRWLLHRIISRSVSTAVAERSGGWRFGLRARRALGGIVRGSSIRRIQRTEALGSVLRSISTVVVYSTAVVMILEQLGVNLAPLIASASIVGVALGFGAQSLVKDILSGAFALLEDQYGVGDVIEVDGTSGVVEAVTLRSTRVRDVHGAVWHLRNGEIVKTGNFSQEYARAVLDVSVSYDSDVDKTIAVIADTASAVAEDDDFKDLVLDPPEVWGVEDWGPNALVIRLVVKTAPLKQWDVARELRRRLHYAFAAAGIEAGSPRQVVNVVQSAGREASTAPASARLGVAPRTAHPDGNTRGRDDDPANQLRL